VIAASGVVVINTEGIIHASRILHGLRILDELHNGHRKSVLRFISKNG
jgi:hypothetical protein